MYRHIVAWRFQESVPLKARPEHLATIKARLEALSEVIGGIISMQVHINLDAAGSNRDAMLDSRFTDMAALAAYQVHPEHKKVSAYVRSVMQDRVCLDFKEP